MEYSGEHSLQFKFFNTEDANEIDIFLDILEKCDKESRKSGFRNMFSKDEKAFIQSLWAEFDKK